MSEPQFPTAVTLRRSRPLPSPVFDCPVPFPPHPGMEVGRRLPDGREQVHVPYSGWLDAGPSPYFAEPEQRSRHTVRYRETRRTGPAVALPRPPRWAAVWLWWFAVVAAGCVVVAVGAGTVRLLMVLF